MRTDTCLAFTGNTVQPEPVRRFTLPASDDACGVLGALQQRLSARLLVTERKPDRFPAIHHFRNGSGETAAEAPATDIVLPLP